MTSRKLAVLLLSAFASLALVSLAPSRASADETPGKSGTASKAVSKPGTITLKLTTVVGNPKRPSAVIEVARAKPEIKLADLNDPAVEKIIRAASKAPF